MPRGPSGERRPGDVVGAAIMVAKIATGEIYEQLPDQTKRNSELIGGTKRAKHLSPAKRAEARSLGGS